MGCVDHGRWLFASAGVREVTVAVPLELDVAADLALERLARVAADELGVAVTVAPDAPQPAVRVIQCGPAMAGAASAAPVPTAADGRLVALAGLAEAVREQSFSATTATDGGVVLAADHGLGLRNALLTLADRLYRDGQGNVVIDPFEGVHQPAFVARHLKTDALNAGPFRAALEYWDASSAAGVEAFADWLASFRITDYDLLAFMRGWGATYASERYPDLADPQHPNPQWEYYPRLIDRLHAWGLRVWAADLYLASGYTMEVGTVPEMASPAADLSRLLPFRAGTGSFHDILTHPDAIVCLANPRAGRYYADLVDELLARYPTLDGLNFHIGHAFPHKLCRCGECRNLAGNRRGVLRCFRQAYEAALARRPHIRVTAAYKMFGDATREVVEHWSEFANLELFCWLRWSGNLMLEHTDAPVTCGHEDGGGGLEANHDPRKTIRQIRDYFRDYEPWLQTYVQVARRSGLTSMSWEPALQRELEHLLFCYSQLTWEPDLDWAALARRYVIRSERRDDAALTEGYRLALEANALVSQWGASPYDTISQRVIQIPAQLGTAAVQERLAALGDLLGREGWLSAEHADPPVAFDLRRSLVKSWRRMAAGEVLGMWH